MKHWLAFACWLAALIPASAAAASPFRTRFLCVPTVAPDRMALEFRVRDQGQCAENERYMEIHRQGDGTLLILPVSDAPSAEERRDLDRYRKYFGGEAGEAR